MDELATIELADEAATEALARALAPCLRQGDVVALRGELGAGKTAFARAVIRTVMRAEGEEVPSPTFTLVQTYDAPLWRLFHFDLYRIKHPDELIEIGWDEALADGVALVEWPERAGSSLPPRRLDVTLGFGANFDSRTVRLLPNAGWADDRPAFAALQRRVRGE
jgi:tRNA threonylcarbamoyladenosine biosynthesis protein TsaE